MKIFKNNNMFYTIKRFRFGSFEIFKTLDPMTGRKGPSVGRIDILKTLLNYVISTFYPEVKLYVLKENQCISFIEI
jgi:hypothetical protein